MGNTNKPIHDDSFGTILNVLFNDYNLVLLLFQYYNEKHIKTLIGERHTVDRSDVNVFICNKTEEKCLLIKYPNRCLIVNRSTAIPVTLFYYYFKNTKLIEISNDILLPSGILNSLITDKPVLTVSGESLFLPIKFNIIISFNKKLTRLFSIDATNPTKYKAHDITHW